MKKEILQVISLVKEKMKESKKFSGDFFAEISHEHVYVMFIKKARTLLISVITQDYNFICIKKTTKIIVEERICNFITKKA